MLSKHPLELPKERRFSKEEIAEALRLSIIAELDAVNLYLQLARSIEDENIRKVFEDIAREEKTHVGEFLSLLEKIDPEQVEELKKGEEEVKELTGGDPPENRDNVINEFKDPVQLVKSRVREVVNESRRLRRHFNVANVRGETAIVGVTTDGKIELKELVEISKSFSIPKRILLHWLNSGIEPSIPQLYSASRELASEEDSLIVKTLLSQEGVLKEKMNNWDQAGVATEDIARALSHIISSGIPGPYLLILNPVDYSKLVKYGERTGTMELHRVKALVHHVIMEPHVPEGTALLLSTNPSVVDIVIGNDLEVSYIGESVEGTEEFRVWETFLFRIKDPKGIIILSRT